VENRLLLDFRTVLPDQEAELVRAVCTALDGGLHAS
jgi:hypothetical protein